MLNMFRRGRRLGAVLLIATLASVCVAQAVPRSRPKKSSTRPVITRDMLPPRGTTMPGPPRERIPRNPTGDHLRDSVTATLEDPNANEEERYTAVYNVEALRIREMKPVLERLAKEDPSPRVRRAATHVLSIWKEFDDEKAKQRAALEETRRREAMTPHQRAAEHKQLMKESILRLRDHFMGQLTNGTLEQRRSVTQAGAPWVEHVPEALPILRQIALSEKDVILRRNAALALASWDGQEAVPALRSCLAAENEPRIRVEAAIGLGLLGHKEGLPVLIELLRSQANDPFFGSYIDMQLKRLTGLRIPYLSYNPFQPRALTPEDIQQRMKAADAWEDWWKSQGQRLSLPARTTQPASQPSPGR